MGQLFSDAAAWWHGHWPNLLWMAVLLTLGKFGLSVLCKRIVKAADDGDDSRVSGKEKRAKTVAGLVRGTGHGILIAAGGVMALRLFGVDTVPLLAGAGVIGVAIGVSLQALIKDIVFGFYLVAENQFAVGDKVKIGEHEGTVHKTNLRFTELLDKDGNLIFIANGSITEVVNYTLGEVLKEKAREDASAEPASSDAENPPGEQSTS